MAKVKILRDGETLEVEADSVHPNTPVTTERRLPKAAQECQRRIFEVADSVAQINMASAHAAGLLTAEQMDAHKAGLMWVAQMRGTWRVLAADHSKDITDDANWPACPAASMTLAAAF